MEIAIKSEADSRVLVYPLIKVLYNYGTVAVYTSNRTLSRLIENELEGGFRNVRVVVNPEADLDDMKESDDWRRDKYDFIIYDNVGAVDYDMIICILTNRLSESYVQDLLYIIQDSKTKLIRFGSPAPALKDTKAKKAASDKNGQEPGEDDREFNKWQVTKTDEDVLKELLDERKSTWHKFPSFEMIEDMEGRHKMPTPDDSLIKDLYSMFGEHLSIDLRMFTKGARVKDESSSDINGTDVR